MVNHLNTIVQSKILEVARKEKDNPLDILEQLALDQQAPLSMVEGILDLKESLHPKDL